MATISSSFNSHPNPNPTTSNFISPMLQPYLNQIQPDPHGHTHTRPTTTTTTTTTPNSTRYHHPTMTTIPPSPPPPPTTTQPPPQTPTPTRSSFSTSPSTRTTDASQRSSVSFNLVGGGDSPQYPLNKVMIWDDHQSRCIGEFSFRSEVRGVRLRRDRIVVVLEQKIFVYNFTDLKVLHQIETITNPRGLCEVSQVAGSFVLVCSVSFNPAVLCH